jgi:hypothetical protein
MRPTLAADDAITTPQGREPGCFTQVCPLTLVGDTHRSSLCRNRGAVRRVMVTFERTEGGGYPTRIEGEDGLVWRVEAVVGHWRHPDLGRYRFVPGHRAEAERWRLTVIGPLPGRPSFIGEHEVVLRTFGEGMSWYLDLN